MKRKVKVLAELQNNSANNQDFHGENAEMFQINEDEFKIITANQVETMLYSVRLLAKINQRKRKEI